MTTHADRAQKYRLRAYHLLEALKTLSSPDHRAKALMLASDWIARAEQVENEAVRVFGYLAPGMGRSAAE